MKPEPQANEKNLDDYRVLVFCNARIRYPRPTEKDYRFIETMWKLGASYKATAIVLEMGAKAIDEEFGAVNELAEGLE